MPRKRKRELIPAACFLHLSLDAAVSSPIRTLTSDVEYYTVQAVKRNNHDVIASTQGLDVQNGPGDPFWLLTDVKPATRW